MTEPISRYQPRTLRQDEEGDGPACRTETKPKEAAKSSLDIEWNDDAPTGGMSSSAAACRPGAERAASLSPTKDQIAQQSAAMTTRASDHPLADDPMGNALVGIVAAGVVGGVEAAGSNVVRPTVVNVAKGAVTVPAEVAPTGGEAVVAGARHAASHAVGDAATDYVQEWMKEHGNEPTPGNWEHGHPVPPAITSAASPSSAPVGATSSGKSSNGACTPVREQTSSQPPPVILLPPIPYAIRG
jgi:hypothetical protein